MRRTVRAYLVVFALAWTSAGPLRAQRTPGPACYRFDRKYFVWVGTARSGGSVVVDSSRIVRLDPAAHPSRRSYPPANARSVSVPAMKVDSFATQRWLSMSFWRPVHADSIELSWRNGLFGPVFRLAVRSDSLLGRVRFTTDVVGAEPPAQPAAAVRTACP